RAGSGLLLATEPGREQLAAAQALAQFGESDQLLQALADSARGQEATLPDDPQTLPAQDGLEHLRQTLEATRQGSTAGARGDSAIGGGAGDAPAWSSPHLVATCPDGLMSLTPADQAWVSGSRTALLAGADLGWMSQGATVAAAGG